jgi:hypothetical protein
VYCSSSKAKGNWLGLTAKVESCKRKLERRRPSLCDTAEDLIELKRQQKLAKCLQALYIADRYDPKEAGLFQGKNSTTCSFFFVFTSLEFL